MQAPLTIPFGRQVRKRRYAGGWIMSAAVHLALISLLVWSGQRAAAELARAPGLGSGRGGGGGGGWGRALALFSVPAAEAASEPEAAPPPPLVVPAPQPDPLPELPPDTVNAAKVALETSGAVPAAGAGQGPGQGPGVGPGSGGGAGGGSGGGFGPGVGRDSGGAGGSVFPPQPQGILLPPTPAPRELRGVRITATFTISERGEVLDVVLDPPIRDRGYREEFLQRMRRYTFTPAHTNDGRPVRATYPFVFTL